MSGPAPLFEQALAALDTPPVRDLDIAAFGPGDVVNLVLQRSEIISDHPRKDALVRAWTEGDDAPLRAFVEEIGAATLIRRAAAVIWLEYSAFRDLVDLRPVRTLADIGCGYGLFDLYAARDFGLDLVLIDLETGSERHFGFEQTGAAYSNLATARRLLTANGIADSRIRTLNPARDRVEATRGIDLAVSFISCGFHYPWTTYETFFRNSVNPGGRIALDIRARTMPRVRPGLETLGRVEDLPAAGPSKIRRVLITRPAA